MDDEPTFQPFTTPQLRTLHAGTTFPNAQALTQDSAYWQLGLSSRADNTGGQESVAPPEGI